MTDVQARYLKRLVAEIASTITDWLDAETAPQSLLEPRVAPQPSEPIAEPKRKRGRPRKTVPVMIVPNQVLEDTANHEQASQTFHCSYCGRVLPVAVRELHEANCRAAAIGPYTHVAQPGKGGSELG